MNEHKPFQVEEVDGVETPPRARVEDVESAAEKLERKKDYLEGFLAQKPPYNITERGTIALSIFNRVDRRSVKWSASR